MTKRTTQHRRTVRDQGAGISPLLGIRLDHTEPGSPACAELLDEIRGELDRTTTLHLQKGGAMTQPALIGPPSVRFFVPGIPAPGGSKTAIPLRRRDGSLVMREVFSERYSRKIQMPIINIVDDGKRNKKWKEAVRLFAQIAWNDEPPLDCPVRLTIEFTMPRPKSHYGTGKNEGVLKPGAPEWHTSDPDTTKLIRSTEDALKGVCWVDDNQVVEQHADKRFGEKPGAEILIEPL